MLSPRSPLSDWLAWLETLSPKEIDLGLQRVAEVLVRLSPVMPGHLLLIAGTNGKGSCVAMTDALLRASGLRVGAYTSPHIRRFNERIVVDGKAVTDASLIAAFELVDAARGNTQLTYFEFATLAASVVFAAAELDVWILEVGLGGRLDATNAFEPTASLITNVSLDHCNWLGDDVEAIAFEKAGVMRSGRPTVFGATDVPKSAQRHALDTGATLLRAGIDFEVKIESADRWHWHGPSMSIEALSPPGLRGEFQIHNAAAVLMLIRSAGLAGGIDRHLVNKTLPAVTLPGRLQTVACDSRSWIFDVAHNPAAAAVLTETLATSPHRGRTIALIGILNDKDLAAVIEPLVDQVDAWVAIEADSPRAYSAAELARQIANLSGSGCYIAASIPDGIEFARRKAAEDDRILVTGSFFTVAPVMNYLERDSRIET